MLLKNTVLLDLLFLSKDSGIADETKTCSFRENVSEESAVIRYRRLFLCMPVVGGSLFQRSIMQQVDGKLSVMQAWLIGALLGGCELQFP